MRKKVLTSVLITTAMLSLVACGKKIDTGMEEKFNPESQVTKLPAEVDDGCISVIDFMAYIEDNGEEKLDYQFVYNEDGTVAGENVKYNQDYDRSEIIFIDWSYNEFGFPITNGWGVTVEDNGDRIVSSANNIVTDPNGYELSVDDVTTYELDGNGNFEWIKDMGGTRIFTYENGLITSINYSGEMESRSSVTDYYYNNRKLIKVVENYKQRDGSGHGIATTTYEDERTVYEEEFYNENEEKTYSLNYETDDRGMYIYYDEIKEDLDDVHLVGTYNREKTVYTLMKQNSDSQVVGYQAIFSEDGRLIKVYKIDKDGKPAGDLNEYHYDAKGHLNDMILTSYYKGGDFSGPHVTKIHYYFKRVPKESHVESPFYDYRNVYKPGDTRYLNLLELLEE